MRVVEKSDDGIVGEGPSAVRPVLSIWHWVSDFDYPVAGKYVVKYIRGRTRHLLVQALAVGSLDKASGAFIATPLAEKVLQDSSW
ncbi:hypothetical protein [Sporomusa carbonis]|uniref:hypothetical protein n=1 Tax=Sporomusa carbonis TaxID=3076075 RepID=UPI003C7ADE4D